MYKTLLLNICFLCFATGIFGQNQLDDTWANTADTISKHISTTNSDSIVQYIETWTLDKQFSSRKESLIDTATINFHIHNPIFTSSISNNYLGYLGSPYQSNIFFDRDHSVPFYFMRNLTAYSMPASKVQFYNTTTPYSSLTYTQGKQESRGFEQIFRAFFTQNIDEYSNLGFRFNVLKNSSQYMAQESHHKFLNLFVSRNSPRYSGYFTLVNGTNNLVENGGVFSDQIDVNVPTFMLAISRFLGTNLGNNNTSTSPYELSINLPGGISVDNKSFTAFTSHEYKMGQLPFINTIPDSLQIDFEPQYSVQYSAEFNNYSRLAAENTVSSSFFDSTYIKTTSHTDSVRFRRFSHIVQLNAFENNNRKFTFSKRVFAENEIVNASHPIPYGIRSYTYSNVYVGGEIARSTSDFWKWSANARFAVLGRNLGDAIIKGNISKDIHFANDTSHIEIEAHYSDIRADIFQEHWQSNHFKWENNFKKQHEVVFKAAFSYPEYLLSTGANYALFSNYLYNNEYAMPAQYNSEFSVISAWINKDFVLGKFCWSGKIVWQQLSNNAVLHLPAISAYSSIYYSHYLFKVMKIQLGADVYYHSPFYANKYEPSSTRFYLQNERKTGGYPVINLYANAKLKRTSAFAQVVHANSMFKIGEFFSVPGYPLEQAAFRFGFIWTFYD